MKLSRAIAFSTLMPHNEASQHQGFEHQAFGLVWNPGLNASLALYLRFRDYPTVSDLTGAFASGFHLKREITAWQKSLVQSGPRDGLMH